MNGRTHLDLFSGLGGFSIGADQAGFQTIAFAEVNKDASRLLKEKYPNVPNLGDVTKITRNSLAGRIDLLTAGWPCQGNSVAGLRQGMDDERSGLFSEVARIITEFQPTWFVLENVPGLLSVSEGRDFAHVIRRLVELGYGVCYRSLDAQYFGVAQRRERVFFVGHLGGTGCLEVLFEPESLCGHPAPSREKGHRTAATIRSRSARPGINPPGRGGEDDENLVSVELSLTIRSSGQGHQRAGDSRGQDPPVISIDRNKNANVDLAGTLSHEQEGSLPCVSVPDLCGTLNDGAHSGGGLTGRTPTADAPLRFSVPPYNVSPGQDGRSNHRQLHRGKPTVLL